MKHFGSYEHIQYIYSKLIYAITEMYFWHFVEFFMGVRVVFFVFLSEWNYVYG